ncbi:MAG TPA: alkaline phosphatase family protein [Gemmatimonadales bacterium]|nr:alkaline phosphatase family protein [Gemmatimonadales bacterium]
MVIAPLVALAAGMLLPGSRPPRGGAADSVPRLVVLLVIDQLRPDQLLRYRAEWTGGFKRILDGGVVFPDGQQDHAITQTGPGHSTILSGRFPAHTGIVTNDLGVPDSLATVLGDPKAVGASPRRFLGSALADWMIARDTATRVLSLAMKDRSAILLVGRSREEVYWWSNLGFFTTSRYYRDSLPDWVTRWNRRAPATAVAGWVWNLSRPASAYPEADSLPSEKGTDDRQTFPHALPADPVGAAAKLPHFPWMDSLTLDLALTGVAARGLGDGPGTDLLSVSLSSVDEIGHDFGPDSREIHDMLLRLDRYLGWFLDSLATRVPSGRTLFVLTSDHGTQAMPEQAAPIRGHAPGRAWPAPMVLSVAAELRERWRTDFRIRFDYGVVTADVAALRSRGVDTDSLSRALARRFANEPYVERVYTPRSLAVAPATDRIASRWRHTLPAGFGWLVAVTPHEGTTWDSWVTGANHGTPWQADVQVPIVFWGGGLAHGTVTRPVRTVDIAPTLARLLGIRPTEPLDGVALPEVARAPR